MKQNTTDLKFYRVARVFYEGGKHIRRNAGFDLGKSPTAFDNLWEPLGIYHKALQNGNAKSLSVLELMVQPVNRATEDYTHYVIEFESQPKYEPKLRLEYRARQDVEAAIFKAQDFWRRVKLYGVELQTIIRPKQENPQAQKII